MLFRIGAIGFGIFIAATSIAGIFFGVQVGNGWLAILYGLLGCSMGLAGVIATFVARPIRSCLLGWFLLGIAVRAVLDGGLDLWVFSLPLAAILVGILVIELIKAGSRLSTMTALGGGALALATLALLAFAAPSLPVICPAPISQGPATIRIEYPISTFPWESAELHYNAMCPDQP